MFLGARNLPSSSIAASVMVFSLIEPVFDADRLKFPGREFEPASGLRQGGNSVDDGTGRALASGTSPLIGGLTRETQATSIAKHP
jgi:hypothetical protein